MATQCSFDITSNVDLQEVDNALNQAKKEVAQRYDFKGSKASIDFDAKESKLVLTADDEFKLNALWEIVQASIQGDQLRVTSSSKDDLQEAMRVLREQDFGVALQFGNYRG